MAESLTIKDMKEHLIKTTLTSLGIVIIGAVSFYFTTNASIDRLNEGQAEMKKTIEVHTDQINKSINTIGMSDVQQANFNQRLTSIEENQKQIYNILLQINTNLTHK